MCNVIYFNDVCARRRDGLICAEGQCFLNSGKVDLIGRTHKHTYRSQSQPAENISLERSLLLAASCRFHLNNKRPRAHNRQTVHSVLTPTEVINRWEMRPSEMRDH